MLSIKLNKDEVTPHLRKLLKQTKANGPLGRVLGRAAGNVLKAHFRARNSKQSNKLGGKRTNFWSRVAQSVQTAKMERAKIVVPINHPAINQKVFGGTIRARKGKNISIPIHKDAHGKSPRVFSNLIFAISSRGNKLLGAKVAGVMIWYYVLKKSVTQSADPDALPTDAEVGKAMEKAGDIFLRKV